MATIRNIASEANVSIATVSRVLNDSDNVSPEVRRRVQEVAGRLGYGGGSKHVGVSRIALVYTDVSSLRSPYDGAILEKMSQASDEQNFDLVIVRLSNDRRPNESAAQLLQRKGIRGAIVRTTAETRQSCVELARDKFPCVVVGERFPDDPVSCVYSDSLDNSALAIEHLISLGHRRIAIVVSLVPDRDHNDRVEAYEKTLRNHGIEVDSKLIYRVWAKGQNGEQVVRNLMGMSDRPTAIFFADPLVAIGAVNQAHRMGVRIPEDVSIVSFDDTDVRKDIYPILSAVCQDAYQVGVEALSSLARLIADPSIPPIQKVLPTLLELHESTGPAPAKRVRILADGTRIDDSPVVMDSSLAEARAANN